MANSDPSQQNTEVVPVTFNNIPPGSYSLQLEFLDGRTQNIDLATTSAILTTQITMIPNSVVFGELIKLN